MIKIYSKLAKIGSKSRKLGKLIPFTNKWHVF